LEQKTEIGLLESVKNCTRRVRGSALGKVAIYSLIGLLGAGGFVGMYLGARFQKFVPQQLIKIVLGLIIIFLSIRYILQFFV